MMFTTFSPYVWMLLLIILLSVIRHCYSLFFLLLLTNCAARAFRHRASFLVQAAWECLLRRHQTSSRTSAVTGGNAGLIWILPCVLHWVAAPLGAAGKPEKGETKSKMLPGRLSGGIWGQLGPPGRPRVKKEGPPHEKGIHF